MVNTTIETLNNRDIDIKYKFQNQKMSTLAMDFLKKEFSSLPLSNMNESGDYIFSCDYIINCQFNGWISKPERKPLHAYDYNKHYTSCLMGKDCTFGWPVYSVFDEVKSLMVTLRLDITISTLIISFHSRAQDGMMLI